MESLNCQELAEKYLDLQDARKASATLEKDAKEELILAMQDSGVSSVRLQNGKKLVLKTSKTLTIKK